MALGINQKNNMAIIARERVYVFGSGLVVAMGAALICGVGLLLREVRREAAEARCTSKMSQLGQALAEYSRAHDSLPPAYVATIDGKPMHSWRVLILPQFGETDFVKEYDMSLPWNSDHNLSVAAKYPHVAKRYQWENDETQRSNFVALIGNEGIWPLPNVIVKNQKWNYDKVIVATDLSFSHHWMEPADINIGNKVLTDIAADGGGVLFASGAVGTLRAGDIKFRIKDLSRDREIVSGR